MIVRLCGGQRQLNSDRAGRLRFFGPTSSLHLSESVTSSVLIREPNSGRGRYQWQDTLSSELQNYLFDLYWKYQHQVLPIIHREALLHDLENGQTKYCSKLLVYCMLTRAASISEHAEVRALALAEDDTNEDPPFLVNKCATLLDAELNNPGITTLQSLQLLSEIYCVICNDTKGWLDAGGACRLAFELGLHSDSKGLGSTTLTQVDLEIRQIAFWSCFSLDRQWALYLGRPQMIKIDDITAQKPEHDSDTSEELEISIVWANLLEIVGIICDALNGIQSTKHRVASLDQKLRDWNSSLETPFHYHCRQTPSVTLLHMQYSAAAILLHRPLANFGTSPPNPSPNSKLSREICVHHACLIAQYLQHYREHHGSVQTMSWIALHMIATASTTLIANLSEHGDDSSIERQLSCLQSCIRALNELEKSHIPTRRVRKVIQQAMRILDLDTQVNNAIHFGCDSQIAEFSTISGSAATADLTDAAGNGAMLMTDLTLDWSETFMSFDEFLPPGSQVDMLQSFESFFA
ncbi:Fc.00g045750.m01.CDS01 [Cosmosporella sp. VM-42]